MSYILKFAGDDKKDYIKSVILALMGVVFSLIPYLLMGDIVRKLMEGEKDFGLFLKEGLLMAVCWILRVVFHTASTNLSHKTTFRLLGNVRTALCDKLSRLPLGTVLDIPSGAMKNIIVERVDSMEPTLAHVVPEFTSNIAAPILMFIYLLTIDWRMALLSLATLPIAMVCMMSMFKDYETPFRRTQDTTKVLNDTAVEYINGIEVIKAFGKAESSYQKFVDAAKDNANSFIDWMRSCIVPFAAAMVIAPATLLAVLPMGAIFTMNGSLALTDFVMIIILSCGLITPLVTVMGYNDDVGKAKSIFGEVDDVLELPELNRPEKSKALPKDHSIELSDVRFGYKEKEVLHGLNLSIPDGSVTALVGPSGSGKSTVARLIASLWDINAGSIKIGGVDIRDMSLADYNTQVAYVSQDNFLFDTTIRENIRMGRASATDAEVEQVARKSGCYDFIMGLEKGFDTVVGGSGAHLSGGERQRISVARAMMKDAPILILDEATAYTDPENEAIIQQSVAKLVQGKTLIVIAHRLSTIVDSDQIIVIQDGNINACGTHEELLKQGGLYAGMWNAHISARDTVEGGARE
ncbi:MAG: ABC transporter ATP-binding protein [Lachnospiraceae bacterium]|nr:ABC transporter ATP-binding protein [Lachnospiraceae bacterium]